MERVERIKHLNVRGFWAQGIVSADAIIPIYTAWCPVEVFPWTVGDGSPAAQASSCR